MASHRQKKASLAEINDRDGPIEEQRPSDNPPTLQGAGAAHAVRTGTTARVARKGETGLMDGMDGVDGPRMACAARGTPGTGSFVAPPTDNRRPHECGTTNRVASGVAMASWVFFRQPRVRPSSQPLPHDMPDRESQEASAGASHGGAWRGLCPQPKRSAVSGRARTAGNKCVMVIGR